MPLQTLTEQERGVVNTYDTPAFIPGAVSGESAIPFVDIGNSTLISGAMFNPGVLAGLTWDNIADRLNDPSDP